MDDVLLLTCNAQTVKMSAAEPDRQGGASQKGSVQGDPVQDDSFYKVKVMIIPKPCCRICCRLRESGGIMQQMPPLAPFAEPC